jgi:hypothetical protein
MIPHITEMYGLRQPVSEVKAAFRAQFEKHSHITDPKTIDFLVMKGTGELSETLELFKTKTHVLKYLETPHTAHEGVAPRSNLMINRHQLGHSDFLTSFFHTYHSDQA